MKLLEALKIVNKAASEGASEYRVYLACSFTPLHLQTFLTAQLRERLPDSDVKVEVGTYGDLIGNLKRLQKSSCQAAAVIIEWSDLDPRLALRSLGGWGPSVLADIQASVSLSVNRLFDLIKEAAASMPIAVCLPTLPLPPLSYLPASQAAAHEIWLRREFHDFALDLSEIQGLKLINEQRLDSASPLAQRLDVKSELTAGFPYSITHANEVADLLAQLIRPVPSKKGLITDLDDTLWRGLLGEVGVTGISWDLDNHTHIHAMYQQLLAALAESGVLIGVASKNDRHLVNEAFERDDLLLPRDYLFPLEVNWGEKSRAVGNILRAWNVSADSVVFVDDNALELAEVKSLYPEIECLLFPRNDNQAAYELFEKLRDLFGKQTIVEEDAI